MHPYDFHVVHVPGTQNIADPLSRLLDGNNREEEHEHEEGQYVRFVAIHATPRAMNTHEVEQESAIVDEVEQVRTSLKTGCFDECKVYAPIARELWLSKLRTQSLGLAHEGHMGIVDTRQKLRTKLWWPGMDKAAERYCSTCLGCQLVARPDPPEPLKPTPLPQGPWLDLAIDRLATILFLVYINDLEEGVIGKILKFADDTKLFTKTKEIGDKQNVQDDIDKLVKWSEKWQMLFNFGKCKCLHIGPGNTSMTYEMGGTILSTTVKEKDLGVTMNANMKVSEQCRIAASKGNQVLGVIRRNISYKDKRLIVPLYKAIVRPHLEYCIQAWSPYLRKDIDML